jgi:GWxTD domain-containing protein
LCLPVLSARAPQRIHEKWLDEDVRWIIADQERAEFLKLSSDKGRDQFIDAFWARRDPTPGTSKNEFKEEHYRRIAYANEHFAHSIAGWKTDRGRIYIVSGPPYAIDFHPCPVTRERPERATEDIGCSHPYQVWHYRNAQGAAREVTVKFVDVCRCGGYRMEVGPSRKDELP